MKIWVLIEIITSMKGQKIREPIVLVFADEEKARSTRNTLSDMGFRFTLEKEELL